MNRPDPVFDVCAEASCEPEHLVCLFVRHHAGNIVAAHVALLAKAVERIDEFSARCGCKLQRLDYPIVMIVPCRSVPAAARAAVAACSASL